MLTLMRGGTAFALALFTSGWCSRRSCHLDVPVHEGPDEWCVTINVGLVHVRLVLEDPCHLNVPLVAGVEEQSHTLCVGFLQLSLVIAEEPLQRRRQVTILCTSDVFPSFDDTVSGS